MLLLIRARSPRIANIAGFVMGMIMVAIGIASGSSATVLMLGGGSSVVLSVVRYLGKRHQRPAGTPATR
jgi:hypothetical protein